MGWGSRALKKAEVIDTSYVPDSVVPADVDWDRLVSLDFETYYDDQYTLKKLTTSEYVRDKRFKAQMVGLKIGRGETKWYVGKDIEKRLKKIDWAKHDALMHHAHFDGLILSHHFGIHPRKIYCSLSMARALFANDIGAGLDEVAQFLGGHGKRYGARLAETKGVLNWPKALCASVGEYCADDVNEMYRIFVHMHPMMPADEMDIINVTVRMFTDPVLQLDRARTEKLRDEEIAAKKTLMLKLVHKADEFDIKLTKADIDALDDQSDEGLDVRRAKKLIGSKNFADLLREKGIEPPVKLSPAWMKLPKDEREANKDKKWAYAFSKTDMEFVELQSHHDPEVQLLVEARLSVKSTTNETRAGRFLKLNENGMPMPVYLRYAAAHTLRWGGGDKTNFQNLKRGGELRLSIKAAKGHVLAVKDSGQIEARVNGWLWDQFDLLDDFRRADAFEARHAHLPENQRPLATGDDRDAYCKFGDLIYPGAEVTKKMKSERFVGKVCVLGLGYQMGWKRLKQTLALGLMGPPVFLSDEQCQDAVSKYRKKNHRIKAGWAICQRIIEQMAAGIEGSYKCIAWRKDTLILPNGMSMHYPNLRQRRKTAEEILEEGDFVEFIYDRKGETSKIYGGLLCENIVQALARIIVAGQLLEISRKHRVVMTTHDEVVAHVKKALAKACDAFMQKAMTTAPAWCADIPLSAEGGYDVIYSK